MTKLDELERALADLPEQEYDQFRCWFLDRDWEKWDRQIEADANAGKLDFLIQEDYPSESSRCFPLAVDSGRMVAVSARRPRGR